MERVQWNQEQMLSELKDLQQKRIFSPAEVREILRKRTAFETALIRRAPRKKDFLAYIEYEMNLERLRRMRVKKLTTGKNHSISDHSMVQRQFQIFERATRKFRADVRLWVQYIDVAQRENARQLASRVCARALKLHPNTIALYVLAAQQELSQGSPSAARALLQRGIRLNPNSVDIWVEYTKMELGFAETLRRRWETLGIENSTAVDIEVGDQDGDGDAARQEILDGAIVKEALRDALNALPAIGTFKGLLHLLQHYPTDLSRNLVSYLYDLIKSILPTNPEALVLFAGRHLKPNLAGTDFIDALKATNEELLEATRSDISGMDSAYARWVLEQFNDLRDPNLHIYLALSLHNLCSSIAKSNTPAPHLMAANLKLLSSPKSSSPIEPSKLLRLSRRYSTRSTHPRLWLARLDIERQHGTAEDAATAWNEARRSCRSCDSESVWLWGVQRASLRQHEELLLELLQQPFSSSDRIHENIFLSALSTLYSQNRDLDSRRNSINQLFGTYLPPPTVFAHSFSLESSQPDASAALLETIFRGWKDTPGQSNAHEEAYFAWSGWLLRSGQPKKALAVVNGLIQQLHGGRKTAAEMKWRKILDGDDDIGDDGKPLEEEGDDSGAAIDPEPDESMSDAASLDGYGSEEDVLIVR